MDINVLRLMSLRTVFTMATWPSLPWIMSITLSIDHFSGSKLSSRIICRSTFNLTFVPIFTDASNMKRNFVVVLLSLCTAWCVRRNEDLLVWHFVKIACGQIQCILSWILYILIWNFYPILDVVPMSICHRSA